MRGWYGWAAVLAVVIAVDAAAVWTGGEPMTDMTRRWWDGGGWPRWTLAASVVFVAVHLLGGWGRADPLDRLFRWLSRR